MTLPIAPQCWDIDELTVDRTQAVAAFGFTERQARFLVTVMLHSGVFVERQYCAFASIVHGQKTHDFLERLTTRGMAKAVAVGPLHRGRLFHVHHKPLYAAIGQMDNRHRKPMSTGRMIERLMVLDAVLDDARFTWLATEFDKRSYFIRALGKDLALKDYPRLTFGEGARQTVRLFPDKMPIGIQRDGRDHLFLYLVTRPEPMDFRVFLLRHAELLRSLRRWTIRVLVPQPFARGIPRFGHAAREVLATPINHEAEPELLWYLRERQKRPHDRAPAEDHRFRTAALLYRAPRFRALSRAWEHQGDGVIYATSSSVLKDKLERREGGFEFVPLSRQYLHLSSLLCGDHSSSHTRRAPSDQDGRTILPPERAPQEPRSPRRRRHKSFLDVRIIDCASTLAVQNDVERRARLPSIRADRRVVHQLHTCAGPRGEPLHLVDGSRRNPGRSASGSHQWVPTTSAAISSFLVYAATGFSTAPSGMIPWVT